MDSIDITRLEEAVIQFYRSTSQEQAITHDWLTKAQASPQAWQFTWLLMQIGKTQEVQFFGAMTLHSKLMKHWQEVPPESREELKQKILEKIVQFAAGPKLVLNRLCIALSAFILHMFNEWPTAIEDVINTFQNQQIPNVSKEMQLWIMLEILQAIPEEMQAVYTSVKRVTLRAQVFIRAPLVMETTQTYLQSQLEQEWDMESFINMIRTVKCISSWVKNVGFPIESCQNITIILLKIVNKCYWSCVQDPDGDGCMSADENELAEISLKTLQNIIIQPDCHLYPKTALLLIKMFLDSLCNITKNEWKRDNNNEDIVVHIYTLFVSAVERHSQVLLSGITTTDSELSDLYRRLVHEILQCTDKPGIYPVEESCSNMAMGFWYLLQDEVLTMDNTEERIKCWEFIKPLYAHLTRILVRKAEQPDETSIHKWSSDDLEAFRCYRQDISDTFIYCYDVLHHYILDILAAVLDETLGEMQNNPTQWTKLEACIFSFQSVAEHFGGEENVQIPKLMRVLSEIPYDNLNEKLLGTSLETVGAYCQWLQENPNYIKPAIELLLRGLNSSMSAQATLGLKELCRDCQLQMKPFAEALLLACQPSLSRGQMKNTDCVRLMYSIGKLMSLLPAEKIPNYLDMIVSPCFEEVHAICQSETKTASARLRTIFQLNMIATLFSSLNTDVDDDNQINEMQSMQPVLIVMQKTMPIFRLIAEVWVDELEVLETACNALKHAIINLKNSFKPMLQDLCYFIVAIFQTRCCAPTLEISKTAILLFYKDESSTSLMQQLLVEFVLHSFKQFENTPENGFSNIAEIIEMFYACLTQLLKKIPQSLDDKAISYDKLIFYALKAMTLPENGPIRTSVQFISHFVMTSRFFRGMTQTMLNAGEEILRTAVLCVGCITPRQQVDKFADIFLAINKKYPAEMATWLKAVMRVENFPTPIVDETEKSKFVSHVIREKVNKRLLQNHLNEFSIKARGLTDKF
ncbi:importin-13 [Teleopsis dalmanni]|uniref:importin-13 n=1 Tax=Teleopsis dalmanni TaxID=139649 RepID=UPI0018CE8F3C|nr:importin-13 [Teleopsis dalmanni]